MIFRKLFLLAVFLVFTALAVIAQNPSLKISRSFILTSDTIQIDTLPLIRGSVNVENYIEFRDYSVNYFSGLLVSHKIPKGSLIHLSYSVLSSNFPRIYRKMDPALILPEFTDQVNPFNLKDGNTGFNPIARSDGLAVNGSIMRGLSIGNNQNAIVNANLNLQLAGKLNNEIDVLAAISDDNNPIQPEGNTQELQDFDQVYVQFSKNLNKLVVGDYLMQKPVNSYFMNYYKKSRGISLATEFKPKSGQTMLANASVALSRGRFVRNIINGSEGNQGPYRLTGPNGELFIILVSGTESVYLDGEKLTRGEQNDYIIDYNSGEITFMPKRLITQYSRIIIEFQYSDRNYARTVLTTGLQWQSGNKTFYLNYFNEQDNKNQPFQQTLSDSNKLLLASVGNNLTQAYVLSEKAVSAFDSKKILYRKIDSLGYTGVYVYTPTAGTDTVFYELKFSYTGKGKGNYIQAASSANGRVFTWVSPVNGVPQGDFEPVTYLIAPNRKQMLNVGSVISINKDNYIRMEVSGSDYDRNLFSELNKKNNQGLGSKVEISNRLPAGNRNLVLSSQVNYEFVTKSFRYIERYRSVEFDRIWSRQLTNQSEKDTGNAEHILGWKIGVDFTGGKLFHELGYYNKGLSAFTGLRSYSGFLYSDTKNQFQVTSEFIRAKQENLPYITGYSNSVTSLQSQYSRRIKNLVTGIKGKSETSKFLDANDTLIQSSYSWYQYGLFIKPADSTRFSYYADLSRRIDLRPSGKEFLSHTQANEARGGISLLQKNFNRLTADISFRDFRLSDTLTSNLKPERTLVSRVEYDYGFFKRFISANSYLQIGSGNELRRDFQYVEVFQGQGIYIWKDFNNDGIQQLNEFQIASFADKNLANYIRVYLPSSNLIRTNSIQVSQTLNINQQSSKQSRRSLTSFLNRFSNQAGIRYERKVQSTGNSIFENLVKRNIPDTSLITLNSQLRNTLFFNRNDPRFGLDLGWSRQESRTLLTNGFEQRMKEEYAINSRMNFTRNWSMNASWSNGNKYYLSQYFSESNYGFYYTEVKPKLTFQWQQLWRVSLNYSWFSAFEKALYGNTKALIAETGGEFRYAFKKNGVLNLKYSRYKVTYNGSTGTALAYDMLQGLSTGNNQIWNVGIQQRLGQNLQISVNYDGRKSGAIPVIHIGRMEARYLF